MTPQLASGHVPDPNWAQSLRVDYPCPHHAEWIDHACTPMVEQMNWNGIMLDSAYMRKVDAEIVERIGKLGSQIRDLVGDSTFNPASPQQVSKLLVDRRVEPPGGYHYGKGKLPSSDDDTLKGVMTLDDSPLWPLILDHREQSKLHSTYTGKFPLIVHEDGRIRTKFGMVKARTGRFNSEDPNLQNIPMRAGPIVRNGFCAQDGYVLVGGDLSQIEMKWAADLSQDPTMLNVFATRQDQHVRTAYGCFKGADGRIKIAVEEARIVDEWRSKVQGLGLGLSTQAMHNGAGWDYEELRGMWTKYKKSAAAAWTLLLSYFEQYFRLPSKVLGFSTLYGTAPPGLQTQILAAGGPYLPVETCEDYIRLFFRTYAGVERWMNIVFSHVQRFGLTWTPFGRVRYIPDGMSSVGRVRKAGIRQAGNAPIQGGAGDHLKLIMAVAWVKVCEWVRKGVDIRPLLTIHDELIFEVPRRYAEEWAAELHWCMCNTVRMNGVEVTSSTGIAERWGGLK